MRFKIVKDEMRKFPDNEIVLPEKGTSLSAGYDIRVNEDKILESGQQHMFWTDIKVKLKRDEFLMIVPRSSIGVKYNLMLGNSVGIIDHDYYENSDNDGNIGLCLYNYGKIPVKVEKGMRVAQGIVIKYVRDTSDFYKERIGGFGST